MTYEEFREKRGMIDRSEEPETEGKPRRGRPPKAEQPPTAGNPDVVMGSTAGKPEEV